MKIILCLLISCSSFAQKKKDNAIIIHGATIQSIQQTLFNNGYRIDKMDSNYISTEAKSCPGFNIKLSILKQNSTFILKGYAQPRYSFVAAKSENYYEAYYGGMKGSELKNIWNEMDKVAKALSDSVEYKKL